VQNSSNSSWFAAMASAASRGAGRASTFALAVFVIIAWAVTGPLFGYSDGWQLVINTTTTIVTFLMVFLIQNSQNRDGTAIQVKLDELIRTGAVRNSFVGIEHLTEDEIEQLRSSCEQRARAGCEDELNRAGTATSALEERDTFAGIEELQSCRSKTR
jgi:low affinity Fe/Cu permease